MARIALVELRAPSLLPRLGPPSLGVVLKRLGHRVRIYCQGLAPVPMRKLMSAGLVGLAVTTSAAPEAHGIADGCVLGEVDTAIGDLVGRMVDRAAPR